jgi:hypothetical protein
MSGGAPVMETSYDVSLDDAVAFAVHHHQTSPLLRRRRHFLRLGLSMLLAIIAATVGGLLNRPLIGLMGLAFALAFWFVFPWRYLRGLRESVTRLYGEGKNVDLLGPTRLVLDDEYLTETTPTREVRTRWAAVERCVDTPTHLFVYVTGSTALIVPKRSLGPGEVERLVAEIEKRT